MGQIIASAPGRCGIVGNPSDMYGGSVLSCSLQKRATCRLTYETEECRITNEDEEAVIRDRDDLRLRGDKIDIARAALTYFEKELEGQTFSLHLSTEIPMRAGMSGSTALLAAIVGAIDAFRYLNMSPYHLAETTRKIEARIMGIVCGLQDQHMAIFGGIKFMHFVGKESLEQLDEEPLVTVEPLAGRCAIPPLLLAHTGVQHHSGTVHRSPRERWLAGEPLFRHHYARIAELAVRGKRALVEGDWPLLGRLMDENHALTAELGGSGEANEYFIAVAREAGAYGAKLAGAGGGGTIIALTDESFEVYEALMEAGAELVFAPVPGEGLIIDEIREGV